MDDLEKAKQELTEAVASNERTCDSTTDEEWVADYKPYRCYFYPGRDCLGWRAGSTCGRLSFLTVPEDETEQPETGPWWGQTRRRD